MLCAAVTSIVLLAAAFQDSSLEKWIAEWDHRESSRHDRATQEIAKIGRPAVAVLVDRIERNAPHGRYAWEALRQIGEDAVAAVPVAVALLQGRDRGALDALGFLTAIGPAAEPALEEMIAWAKDRHSREPEGWAGNYAARGGVLRALGKMSWATERVLPIVREIASSKTEVLSIRYAAISALGGLESPSEGTLRKLTRSDDPKIRVGGHFSLGKQLEEKSIILCADYLAAVARENPLDPEIFEYLLFAGGMRPPGPEPELTRHVKESIRAALKTGPDLRLALALGRIIERQVAHSLQWSSPQGWRSTLWPRLDPEESTATFEAVLLRGLESEEGDPALRERLAIAVAKLRLLRGDWAGMNAMLREVGRGPVERPAGNTLSAPPVDWTDLDHRWRECAIPLRSGTCTLEMEFEKNGKGLAGVHVMLQRRLNAIPRVLVAIGTPADSILSVTSPLGMRDDEPTFGCLLEDRSGTRYAVTDDSGSLRFERLPAGPYEVEIVVPTANFPEPGQTWELCQQDKAGTDALIPTRGSRDPVLLRAATLTRLPRFTIRRSRGE